MIKTRRSTGVRLGENPFTMLGCAVVPVAWGIAFVSAGFGHGSYIMARIMLPFACMAIPSSSWFLIALALVQWPLYGIMIDRIKPQAAVIAGVLIVHVCLCLWLFTKGSEAYH